MCEYFFTAYTMQSIELETDDYCHQNTIIKPDAVFQNGQKNSPTAPSGGKFAVTSIPSSGRFVQILGVFFFEGPDSVSRASLYASHGLKLWCSELND